MQSQAMVQTGDRHLESIDFEIPSCGPGEALLRVEATGICGTDHEQFAGHMADSGWVTYPLIPGHEPVGRIVEMGDEARQLWNVGVGDLVAVESIVPCHVCTTCVRGQWKFCKNRFTYGFTPTTFGCGLWGGFSQYIMLRPNTILHRIPDQIPAELATLFNPLGAGFDWAVERAGTMPGDTVVVLGCGQRGLACVIAAKQAGAERIVVTGLARDRRKLDLALQFGADSAIDISVYDDSAAAIIDALGGELADRVIDTTPIATQPVADAIEVVRPEGVVVLAGVKGNKSVPEFVSDRVVLKAIDVRGVLTVNSWGYLRAIELMASGDLDMNLLHTHSLPLSQVEHGIRLLAGDVPGEDAIHISILPNAEGLSEKE
jgi:threonine dehydrogenase-like Zn-dependent dehydrogenase